MENSFKNEEPVQNNPLVSPYFVVVIAVFFIIVAIPLGIFISKKLQPQIKSTGAENDSIPKEFIELIPTPDAKGCVVTCTDECKRADNCLGEFRQGGHCGWTKTKPVIEKKWCRTCLKNCISATPEAKDGTVPATSVTQ